MMDLNLIRIDGGTQSRVELNQETVAEYAEAYKAGAEFPPVVVFFDGTDRWLADGYHRYFGAKAAGLSQIYENVTPGTKLDAELYSFGANGKHGLRRTNADKRKAVTGALKHPVSRTWSDNQIAKHCGVSDKTVAAVRLSIFGDSEDAPTVRKVERNGKTYEQDTSKIGKQRSTPAAALTPVAKTSPKAAKVDPEDAEYFGPSESEIAAAVAGTQEDLELLHKLMEADDKLAVAVAENDKLRAELAVVKLARDGYMNRSNELISRVTSLKKQLEKAKAANV